MKHRIVASHRAVFLYVLALAVAAAVGGGRAWGSRLQNQPPTITAAAALTRQQGAAAQAAQIATVSDAETAAGSLVVTATTTPVGISVTGIANNNGAITASVAASCAAAAGTNIVGLTVTDGGATATANLTIEVAAAPALTLGSYPVARVPQGMGATFAPSGTPTGIQTVTAEAAGFTGTFSADPVTGAITIANAGPAGDYTVIVTANGCGGGTVLRTFPLTVTAPTSWTSAGLVGTAIERVTIAPAGPSSLARIFALGSAGAFRLFRGGVDWASYSGGGLDAPILDLTALRLPDNDRFVAATATGLYLSVDGGQNYSRKVQAAAGCPIRLITPSLLGAAGHPLAAIRQCDGREFLSFDRGATWTDRAGPSSSLRAAAIRYDDPTFALGATAAGVLKVNYLAPAGQNQWSVTGFTQPTNAVAIAGSAQNLLFAGTAGAGLHRSANAGATWVRYGRVVPGAAELPAYVHEIVVHPANREILYLIASETAAGRRSLYRSQDAGESWSLMNAGLENLDVRSLAVDLSGRYGYAGTENGVFAFTESAAINSAPAIAGGGSLTRQQGSPGAAASVAMVMDAEQAKGLLRVEATTVPGGIAITEVNNVDGAITATIAAGCNAAVGANTIVFTVHDGEFSAAASLTVNVTANAPPSLGAYAATTVTAGSGVTVAPGAPPTDNGAVMAVTASAPGFSGTLSVDPATGVVSIGSAGPAGGFTVTVTATDNCGGTTMRSFPLTVNPVLPPACAAPPANLISWYRAEGNGFDAIGLNPGALQDGVSFAAGRVGQAFNFDGVDDAVRVPASTTLNLGAGDGFTLLAWINPADVSTRRPLLEWNTGAAASTQLWLGVTCAFAGCETTPGALHATLPVSGGSPGIVQTGAILTAGEFQLVGLSYDKASGQARLYRNGIVVGTRDVGSASRLTAGDLYLGARPGSTLRFQGLMDEVDLYARALTEAEILAIYNAGGSGKCLAAINAPPTITAANAIPRQQGSAATTAAIATVSDAETPAGNLIVTATNVPAGITITNLTNVNGAISASIAAGCNAAPGASAITLTVTDAVGLTATTSLTINVTANTPPTLGDYQGVSMTAGGTVTVAPAAPPADNGPLASLTVRATGFGGTLAADVATGVVTIGRAGPAGSYTVVVTATDSCGASIVRSFPLTVTCPVIVINPADPPEGALGVPYSLSFSQSGGFGNATFAASGILPPGLSFSGNTLSGTPTQLGTFSFNIRATDAVGCGGSRDYRLTVGNPRPTLASINPAFVVAGAPAFTLTVTGANFISGATIHWNGAPRTTTFVSATQLTAQIPASDVAMNGAANVTVVNPAPGGGASGSISFTIQPTSFRFDGDAWPRPAGDGIVNASDWRQIVRYALKLDALPAGAEFQRADCAPRGARGDQRLDLADIVQAQRYAAGLDPLVEAGGPSAPALDDENGFAPAAQPGARVTIAPGSLARGQIGAVDVRIEGTGSESAVAFTLNFNPAQLVFVDARLGAAAPAGAELFVRPEQALNGRLGLLLVLPAGQSLPAGPIAPISLRFFAAGGAATVEASFSFGDEILARASADVAAAGTQPLGSVNAGVQITGSAVAFLSAASFAGGPVLAPDSIVAAFGANLAAATEVAAGLPLPTSLAGTTVTITDSAGAQLPAPLFFVSANQINYLLPTAAAEGVATVTIRNRDGVASTGLLRIAPVAPGLFSANANGTGVAAAYVLRVAANGAQLTEEVARFDATANRFVPVPIDFGPAGDRLFLVLFGSGLRKRTSLDNVSASIAGLALPAAFASSAPGFAGLDQVNLELPRSLAGRGLANLILTVDGAAANTVQVQFR